VMSISPRFVQRLENCPRAHAPDLFDLRAADRLPIGNDR